MISMLYTCRLNQACSPFILVLIGIEVQEAKFCFNFTSDGPIEFTDW